MVQYIWPGHIWHVRLCFHGNDTTPDWILTSFGVEYWTSSEWKKKNKQNKNNPSIVTGWIRSTGVKTPPSYKMVHSSFFFSKKKKKVLEKLDSLSTFASFKSDESDKPFIFDWLLERGNCSNALPHYPAWVFLTFQFRRSVTQTQI